VFVFKNKNKVRLVVRYRTRSAAQVTTSYTAHLPGGKKLLIGKVKRQFKVEGIFRLPKNLKPRVMAKVRRAKRFTVVFKIPGTPQACVRFYTRKLTKKVKVSQQTVWFQSDSVLTGF
jgi:hypothetical protein